MNRQPDPDIERYYNQGKEENRLFSGLGQFERARTLDILARHLPPPPAVLCDIGGGAGVYALELARQGYEVHLVDLMPLHIEQAQAASAQQPDHPLASVTLGDARQIERSAASVDAVLLLGPLYHLLDRADRVTALAEAARIVRPGGVVCAAAISRYASFHDGLWRGFMDDPAFEAIATQDLQNGQHRNIPGEKTYFATSYFHHPAELRDEVTAAGLTCEALLAVEGTISLLPDFDAHWDDPVRRQRLFDFLQATEAEPSLLGATGHLVVVGRKA